MCGGTITNAESTVTTVTMNDIISRYGARSPGPATAKRDFSLGFVAESNQRLFNAVEMTFYDIFAAHFTKSIPAQQPDPYLGFNWTPITRFVAEGTTWHSDVLSLIRPQILSTEILTGGVIRLTATGYPGRSYRLLSSTNLSTWLTVTNQTAATNGICIFTDTNGKTSHVKFYRMSGT